MALVRFFGLPAPAPSWRQRDERAQAQSRRNATHPPPPPPPPRRVSKPRPMSRGPAPHARAWGRSRRQASAIYPERRRRRTLAGNRHVSYRGGPAAAASGGGRCGTSRRMAEASERLYRVEYAKSGRASCKKCSESIPKDSLRMAIMVQVRRGRAGGAGRRCVGSGPPRSRCGSLEPGEEGGKGPPRRRRGP